MNAEKRQKTLMKAKYHGTGAGGAAVAEDNRKEDGAANQAPEGMDGRPRSKDGRGKGMHRCESGELNVQKLASSDQPNVAQERSKTD